MAFASRMFGGKKSVSKKGKSKKSNSKKSNKKGKKTGKKGGNPFLTAVGEIVFPTGFEQAATTAGLFAANQLTKRRDRKGQKGGMSDPMMGTQQPGMDSQQLGMMGTQPGMMGTQQPGMDSQQLGMMGTQPGMMGTQQPGMMGLPPTTTMAPRQYDNMTDTISAPPMGGGKNRKNSKRKNSKKERKLERKEEIHS